MEEVEQPGDDGAQDDSRNDQAAAEGEYVECT